MKKWSKRIGIALAILIGILALAIGGAFGASVYKQGQTYELRAYDFEIPTDEASLVEGGRLYVSRGCKECHGENGAGRVMLDDPGFGLITTSNLTVLDNWEPALWDRAIRHGLRSDGTSLVFMPSFDFELMNDRELGALVAYIRSLPQVDDDLPALSIGPVARMVDLAGGFILFPGSAIAHGDPPDRPDAGRTVEYGASLARLCTGCHGEHFSGGPIPGAPPELGTPLNITMHSSGLRGWSEEDFRRVLREGVTKSGHHIRRTQMPWPDLSHMNDDEIGAIWMYLQTVPERAEGER